MIRVLRLVGTGELELWTLRRDGAWELLPTHLRQQFRPVMLDVRCWAASSWRIAG